MIKGHVKKVELENLLHGIENLVQEEKDRFLNSAALRLGNAVMGKARELTPVGDYSDRFPPYNNRTGGTLRDSWKITKPRKRGDATIVKVKNPQKYASYVNYGHKQHVGQFIPPYRKNAKVPFVKGQYFLERAEYQTLPQSKPLLKPLLDQALKKVFNND